MRERDDLLTYEFARRVIKEIDKCELPEFLYIDGVLDEPRMRIIWERIGTLDFSKVTKQGDTI